MNNGLIGWEDISTAPRDGTYILLFADGIIEGYWFQDKWCQCVTTGFFYEQPTHWAEIPNYPF